MFSPAFVCCLLRPAGTRPVQASSLTALLYDFVGIFGTSIFIRVSESCLSLHSFRHAEVDSQWISSCSLSRCFQKIRIEAIDIDKDWISFLHLFWYRVDQMIVHEETLTLLLQNLILNDRNANSVYGHSRHLARRGRLRVNFILFA